MKLIIFFIIANLLFLKSNLVAQDNSRDTLSESSKIDSIYLLQKKMYQETRRTPLADKKFGVELNIFRLLAIEKSVSLSGGFSLFSVNRDAEISFPIFFSNPGDPKDLKEFTIDCHFRYFLGNTQDGFYISTFARYAHLEGYKGTNDLIFDNNRFKEKRVENKLGIGVGIGYRIFSYKGFYWGTSTSFGRFFVGDNNQFYGSFLALDDDEKFIFDFELLKFGYAF